MSSSRFWSVPLAWGSQHESNETHPAVLVRLQRIPGLCSAARRRPHHEDGDQPVLRQDEGRRHGRGQSQRRQADERRPASSTATTPARSPLSRTWSPPAPRRFSSRRATRRRSCPAIKKARDAGVLVIALDTPTDPQSATDALFATDNFKAGVLIGQYAKAAMAGKTGQDRHARPRARHHRRQAAPRRIPAGLRHQGRRPQHRVQPGHAGRSGQGADRDGELPAEGAGHQRRLHHQRAGRRRRLSGAQGGRARKKAC